MLMRHQRFATGPASEKRGSKIDNSPAKVWEAENEWGWASASRQDGTLRIIHEWICLCELDSFSSGKRTRKKLQRRRAACIYHSLWRYPNRNGFLNAIAKGG
jgi:hypothetical protein